MNNLRVTAFLWIAILGILQAPGDKGTAKNHSATGPSEARTATDTRRDTGPDQTTFVLSQKIEAPTDKAKTGQSSDDIEIQRQLAKYTRNLVWVGIGQAVVLAGTLLVIWRQANLMKTHAAHLKSLADAAESNNIAAGGQLKAMQDQLGQMESSGKQTDKMIEHASQQVAAIKSQAELMKSAGTHTETLAAQAVKQSDLTQRQLDLANRPWICIDSVTPASDLTFKDSGEAVIFFAYQIRNVGHSVAQHLQPWVEPIITGINDPLEVKERISTQLRKPIDSAFDHGKLIFPGQIIVDTYPVLIRKEAVDSAIANSPFMGADNNPMPCFGFELFVCFDYQSTLDPTIHHQTQSMFILTHAGLRNGVFYPSQRAYRANEIRVGYKGYGAYAD